MMPPLDAADMKRLFAGKGAQAMAEMIIGNLVGYRSGSRYRDEDVQTLKNAIMAILEMGAASGGDR